ncbi:hypothetical protein JHK87_054509 [Glycine soja]|nr:hypothetical protein JHK87_054509 [Glycine soja]
MAGGAGFLAQFETKKKKNQYVGIGLFGPSSRIRSAKMISKDPDLQDPSTVRLHCWLTLPPTPFSLLVLAVLIFQRSENDTRYTIKEQLANGVITEYIKATGVETACQRQDEFKIKYTARSLSCKCSLSMEIERKKFPLLIYSFDVICTITIATTQEVIP